MFWIDLYLLFHGGVLRFWLCCKLQESRGTLSEAPEPTKIRMRDLVRLNPSANPMSGSSDKDKSQGQGSTPSVSEVVTTVSNVPPAESVSSPSTADAANADSEAGSVTMAPQVRVAEDGSIVIDESR